MSTFEEFTDPRLVPVYDLLSDTRDDLGRFLELAAALDARTVLDVGCGTGAGFAVDRLSSEDGELIVVAVR